MRLRSLLLAISLGTGALMPLFSAGPASAKDRFCADVVAAKKQSKLMGTLKDPTAIAKATADFAAMMKKSEGRSPDSVKADWKKMSEGLSKVSGFITKMTKLTVAQAATDLPKIQADMDKVTKDKAFSVAGSKVSVWAKTNCGIDLQA